MSNEKNNVTYPNRPVSPKSPGAIPQKRVNIFAMDDPTPAVVPPADRPHSASQQASSDLELELARPGLDPAARQRIRAVGSVVGPTGPAIAPPEPWQPPAPLNGGSSPLMAWPWDAMPSTLEEMGQAVARTVNVPDAMAGAAALGMASIALRNRVEVEIKPGHRLFGNLYTMIAAPPGTGKTPCFRPLRKPVDDWQRRNDNSGSARAEWKAKDRAIEAKVRGVEEALRKASSANATADIASLEARLKTLESARSPEPSGLRLYCSDATSEALGRRMHENQGAMGVLTSEGRKVLAIARGRYTDGGDIDLWLAGHAGDAVQVDRQGKPSYRLDRPCLAALIAVQPDSLAALGKTDCLNDSGFLPRWLYIVPDPTEPGYPLDSIRPDVADKYEALMCAILDLPLSRAEDGAISPLFVPLEGAARELWIKHHDRAKRQAVDEATTLPPIYRAWLEKLPDHVARIALIIHAVNRLGAGKQLGSIDAQEMAAALVLSKCLGSHARRAAGLMGGDPVAAKAQAALTWCQRHVDDLKQRRTEEGMRDLLAIKPSDLSRAGVAGISDAEEAKRILDRLEAKGWAQHRSLEVPSHRSHQLWLLHPDVETAR